MKIVFYGDDGAAGKARVASLRAEKVACRLVHASACHEAEKDATSIEFMPDVSKFDQDRLTALFDVDAKAALAAETGGGKPKLTIAKGQDGKLYIMDGEKIHSGPFEKSKDAKAALAKEVQAS